MDLSDRLADLAASVPDSDRLEAVQQRATRLHRRRVLTASGTSGAVLAVGIGVVVAVLPGQGAGSAPRLAPTSTTAPTAAPTAATVTPVPLPSCTGLTEQLTVPGQPVPTLAVRPASPPAPAQTAVASPAPLSPPARAASPTPLSSPPAPVASPVPQRTTAPQPLVPVPAPTAATAAPVGPGVTLPSGVTVPLDCLVPGGAPGGVFSSQFTG